MKITDVRTFITAPAGLNLVVVRVDTDEPGLYGLGCATFAWQAKAVKTLLDEYFKPFLVGRAAANITDIWNSLHTAAYWRNGPVQNNAISGIDMALWDIKGKKAGMPVYRLLGGACRGNVPVYVHAGGKTPAEAVENVRARVAAGATHVRVQAGGYGGVPRHLTKEESAFPGNYYDPAAYIRTAVEAIRAVRAAVGDGVELLHDVHERLAPADAVRLAQELEPYRLFYLEDLLPPHQPEWFRNVRARAATPLAMGELFNHPLEWRTLVDERLIDFIRCHVSQLGGITPAKNLAVQCEPAGIRTAWHGPPDCSPVGHAANVHLSASTPNFGIQEWCAFKPEVAKVFPGMLQARNGAVPLPDAPGLGVGFDEEEAAKYPHVHVECGWMHARLSDGTAGNP